MNVIKSLKWRYATKKFNPLKKVSANKIEILKEAFNLTATSYGLQTLKLMIVSNQEVKNQLVESCYGQEQVANSSHLLVICIQKNVTDVDVDTHFDNISDIRKTPESILKKFREELKKSVNTKTLSEQHDWCTKQAYIALGNLMTVCALERIDACPMEGFVPEKVDDLLKLDTHNLKSVLLMPIGYRAEDDMFASLKKVRKKLSEAIIEI